MASADLLSIVEAAYRIDLQAADWLHGLAVACHPLLDGGFGVCAFEFRHDTNSIPECLQMTTIGMPSELAEFYPRAFQQMHPTIRARPFLHGPCTTASVMMGMGESFRRHPQMAATMHPFGIYDTVWITAAEPSGWGVGLHAGRADITRMSGPARARWSQLSAHFANAARLRRRLASASATPRTSECAEAVLNPDGSVVHATGPASVPSALTRLRQAVVQLERVRGPQRQRQQSLEQWAALTAGRWSLIDEFHNDGKRYIVACENGPKPPGPQALTARETQVLGYAALGHHNKLIAYDLGISAATVRVLLSRAAAKLGVRTRDEVVRVYRRFRGDELGGATEVR